MHLNAPRTACLCKETCSSKQAAIPPERFAAAAIQLVQRQRGIVTAHDRAVYPCEEAYRES